MRRALKILADREVSPQTGLLKSTLLQLDSTFSERNYGASSFLDFVEKLAQAGLVQLKHVGPQRDGGAEPGFAEDGDGAREAADRGRGAEPPTGDGVEQPVAVRAADSRAGDDRSRQHRRGSSRRSAPRELPRSATTPTACASPAQLLAGATNARWPMYLRNVKQILRSAAASTSGATASAG